MMGTAAARFERVEKSYDGRTLAVRDLDLTVDRGEFLTLLGPSGSGKTTCLLMLAGFEVPTAGQIYLQGRPVTRLPPHRREIGMVFQNYALFPHLTVVENIAFPLSVRGRPRAEIHARVARAVDMIKLTGLGGRRPAQLSGGQQQRVALARALVYEPQLILLDEPLGALDKQLREEMQYELKRLHRMAGVTMIYVTHDQSEAMAMSDRIAVFHHGQIQQVATPRTLYEQPANAFVAGFVGESNRLLGAVEGVALGKCRVRLAGDQSITCLAPSPLALGAIAVVSIRPERVRVAQAARSDRPPFLRSARDLGG
jgi:putative spermidine/putrescine transport system ATP-binding protein